MTESLDTDAILLTAILNGDDPMKSRTYSGTAQYNDKELREAANALVMHHSQDVDSVAKGSRKRKIVDEDERAKNSRDRNREHAKNTRLRKKAYVSKLNDLVYQFKISRDMDTEERTRIAIQLFNSQSQKKSVALLFLKYRCENTRSRLQWAAILDEDFKLTLPITPFRYFHKSEIRDGRRLLHGIDAVIADTASVNLMTESIGQGTPAWIESTKRDEFHKLLIESSPSDIVCSMNTVFCKFHFRLVNERTMTTVCHQAAMLNCYFDGHDKIVSAELVFDVMNFINQLQRVVGGSPEGSIVPNTLDMVLLESSEARLIVGKSPFRVMFANKAWTTLTGFTQSELEGKEFLTIFSEAQLDLPSIHGLVRGCVRAVPGRVILCGEGCKLFKQRPCGKCYLKMIPLTSSSSDVSHFLISLVSLE